MSKNTLLRIMGLSAAEIRGEAYVLILAEADGGPRRIPIILGRPEAQAIGMVLENVRTERPTTHELFVSFAGAFGIGLDSMLITRFENGVYYSELTFSDGDGERTLTMDSRTSDALVLALRTGTPVYASPQVMETAGFVLPHSDDESEDLSEESVEEFQDDEIIDDDFVEEEEEDDVPPVQETRRRPNPENYTVEELERTLKRLIDNENYEEAARINDILNRKRGNK